MPAGGMQSATGGSGRRAKAGSKRKFPSHRMQTGMTAFYEAQKGGGFGSSKTKRKKKRFKGAPAKTRNIG